MATRRFKKTLASHPICSKPPSGAPSHDPRRPSTNHNPRAAPDPEHMWEENTRPDFNIQWHDPSHKETFDFLKGRKLVSSQFIHIETIQMLGLYNDIKLLCDKVGIWELLTTVVPTFRTLTYEFLATYKCNKNCTKMTFQLDGITHTLTDKQLNMILKCPQLTKMQTGANWKSTDSRSRFYYLLFGRDLKGKSVLQIQHPALRYLQKVLSHTIFGRGESSGKINDHEMYFIYCMIQSTKPTFQPNVGHYVAYHFATISEFPTKTGDIAVGGIVTRIAQHFNLIGEKPYMRTLTPGPTSIDLPCLLAYKFIERRADYYVNVVDGNGIRLPYDIPFDPNDPDTWILDPYCNPDADSDDSDAEQAPAPTISEWRDRHGTKRPTSPPRRHTNQTPAQPSDPTNAMIYEQLTQIQQMQLAQQQQLDEIDERSYETWHMARYMQNWHVAQQHFAEPQFPPRPPRRTRHQRQPDEAGPSHGPTD